MFLLMGMGEKEEQLPLDQLEICPVCGRYGRVQVFMRCRCLTLFFLPVFRWNRQYCVRMSCCSAAAPLSHEAGELVRRGEAQALRLNKLDFRRGPGGVERCPGCGALVAPGYRFCPHCGRAIS